jgi:hypothetical protein
MTNDENLSIQSAKKRMNTHSKSKSLLALVLAISIAATGCSAQWINIALQDLPLLTQMALNIATLVGTLTTGKQTNNADLAVVQNISAQASRDLNLLQTLYGEYKANPNDTRLAKIQSVIAALNQNLPILLESAHISNPLLAARVTAAVNLLLGSVNSLAALIPHTSVASARIAVATPSLPTKQELKQRWNQQVCSPSGDGEVDAALSQCKLR